MIQMMQLVLIESFETSQQCDGFSLKLVIGSDDTDLDTWLINDLKEFSWPIHSVE